MFLIGSKNQNNKIPKQEQQKTTTTRNICKAKTNQILWFKTKQDNKQNKKTQNSLKEKNTKRISKNQIQKWKTERKEERKEQERERERERETNKEKVKKEEAPKRLKRNKGRQIKIHKNALFFRGTPGFCSMKKARKAKKNKQQQKEKIKKKEKEGLGPSEVALWATSPDPSTLPKNKMQKKKLKKRPKN